MLLLKQSVNRFFIGLARELTPVITLGGRTFVFRDADVREVLSRNTDFTIRQINAANIGRNTGPFILGMDDGEQYRRDQEILRRAVKKEDVQNLRRFIRETAARYAVGISGETDIVEAYTRRVPLQLMGHYFGTPGPSAQAMLRWNRTVFRDVFLNLDNDPRVRETAARSSNEMNDYLRTLIRERKAILADGGKLEDNMLNRLIEMQGGDAPFFTDDEIRSNIAGVFLGALELTSKACVNVLQQFFARKDVLEQARKAALADDVETMNKLAMEAMRFQPNMPVLLRYCGARQTIGGNGRRKRTVPAGKKVFAVISSAMFDRRTMTKPGRFDAQRPAGDYLYYGFGQHACFGTYINFVSIPEMLVALLRIKDLQPVAGKRGEVVYEGPFPKSWKWIRG